MTKQALLVGINYTGTFSALNGCINDVQNIKKYLLQRGYSEENITVLTDETAMKPTRVNILTQLLKLILCDAKKLFFHYSGHGSYVRDEDGDEPDGKDECLCPIDYEDAGMILDDELRGILQCLNEGKKLTVLLDCCHSGSGCDLSYNMCERAGRYLMVKTRKQRKTRGDCVMISGCRDNQTSADAYIEGNYQGALTNSFLDLVSGNAVSLSYEELVLQLRLKLKNEEYSQIPCLSSGKKLQLTSQFSV